MVKNYMALSGNAVIVLDYNAQFKNLNPYKLLRNSAGEGYHM